MGFIGDIVSGIMGSGAAKKAAVRAGKCRAAGITEFPNQSAEFHRERSSKQRSSSSRPNLPTLLQARAPQTSCRLCWVHPEGAGIRVFKLQLPRKLPQLRAISFNCSKARTLYRIRRQQTEDCFPVMKQQRSNNMVKVWHQRITSKPTITLSRTICKTISNTRIKLGTCKTWRIQAKPQLGKLNALNQAGAQNQGALNYGFAGQENQQTTNYGNAKASGYIGANNAWQGSIAGINNTLGGLDLGNTGAPSWLASLL